MKINKTNSIETAAHVAILYAENNPKSKIGVITSSFRRAKRICVVIQTILEKQAEYKCHYTYGNSELQIGFPYGSNITAMSAGLHGSYIRGYRFDMIVTDSLIPEKIKKEVIIPSLAVSKDSLLLTITFD